LINLYRRNGVWYGRFPELKELGRDARISLKTTDREVAVLKAKRIERELATGTFLQPEKPIPIEELFEKYLEYSRLSKNPRVYKTDRFRLSFIKSLADSHKVKTVGDITPAFAEKLKAEVLKRSQSPGSYNQYLQLPKAVLNKAIEWGDLSSNPLRFVKKLKPHKVRTIRYLTMEEIQKAFDSIAGTVNSMVRVLAYTGLRLGEMIHLSWEDVNFRAGYIAVQSKEQFSPKSREVRHVPINDRLRDLLLTLKKRGHQYVFDNGQGKPLYASSSHYTRKIKRALSDTGIKDAGAHTLRHTFISHLFLQGVPITVIRELAGHKDISTTMRYAHLSAKDREEAVQRLPF